MHLFQKYVQDLLREDASNISDLIIDDTAHVYVCGGAAMADDVTKTLQVIGLDVLTQTVPITLQHYAFQV